MGDRNRIERLEQGFKRELLSSYRVSLAAAFKVSEGQRVGVEKKRRSLLFEASDSAKN